METIYQNWKFNLNIKCPLHVYCVFFTFKRCEELFQVHSSRIWLIHCWSNIDEHLPNSTVLTYSRSPSHIGRWRWEKVDRNIVAATKPQNNSKYINGAYINNQWKWDSLRILPVSWFYLKLFVIYHVKHWLVYCYRKLNILRECCRSNGQLCAMNLRVSSFCFHWNNAYINFRIALAIYL